MNYNIVAIMLIEIWLKYRIIIVFYLDLII